MQFNPFGQQSIIENKNELTFNEHYVLTSVHSPERDSNSLGSYKLHHPPSTIQQKEMSNTKSQGNHVQIF